MFSSKIFFLHFSIFIFLKFFFLSKQHSQKLPLYRNFVSASIRILLIIFTFDHHTVMKTKNKKKKMEIWLKFFFSFLKFFFFLQQTRIKTAAFVETERNTQNKTCQKIEWKKTNWTARLKWSKWTGIVFGV